ncbi:LamG-like jellyroll fold domain-containing protein [uncultured Flavobacterium sp.]|uniref:LamG-like jellyroll fold domain-containing protein n=1 Tax=uncultured Flavobacterium sp. TaxID=165435 RepID=UPI0025D65BAB|nr:LamG-like jellyroll fold domain-containing protein [uncultured Flavobacterium sp.]
MKKVLLIAFLFTINQVMKSQTANKCISFSGSASSYASFGNISELNGVNQFTFEAWVYISTWNANSYIFSKMASTLPAQNRIDIQLGQLSTKRLYFHVSNNGNSYAQIDNSAITVGKWNHIVMAYDGTKSAYNMIRVYINGTQVTSGISYSSGNGTLPASTSTTTGAFELGKSFSGMIDEVKLWNFALTGSDIEMKNTINKYHPLYSNLISYWKMDKDDNLVADTKNQYQGQMFGSSLSTVTNNSIFRYSIVSGYIRSNFYESGQVSEEYVRNNNDLIYMAASPYANGDLFFEYPINNAVLTNASYLSNYNSRNGVMDFSGNGSSMNCGGDLLNKATAGTGAFSFATWVYIDQWIQDSYIFRKYESASNNIDLQLGEQSTSQLVFHLSNGSDNYVTADNSGIAVGSWHHVAVTYSGAAGANQQVKIYIDGVSVPISYKNNDGLLPVSGPFIRTDFELGVNFDGKLDETSLNLLSLSSAEINALKNSEIVVDSWNETKTCAYWKYDEASNPGKDSRTWTGVLNGLKETLSGYDGAEIRLGISAGDWKNMIASSTARTNFANKVKNIVETYGFDGVDLDFEWCSTAQEWSDYSAAIVALNNDLPANLTYSVTLHPLYYKISSAAISALDYISIQSYGPSPERFPYNEFVNNISTMITYGYPASKLIMGLPFYGVTSDNTKITVSYRAILASYPALDPSLDNVTMNVPATKDITFNGQQTIINKTKYVRDMALAGVMYWDTATDVDYINQLSLLRALNTVMNSNLEETGAMAALSNKSFTHREIIEEDNISRSNFSFFPNPAKNVLTIVMTKEQTGNLEIFNVTGEKLLSRNFKDQTKLEINVSGFKTGLYLIKYSTEEGGEKKAKLIIQ